MRVTVLGLGHAGRTLHLPALSRLRGVAVVAACDPDEARRADLTHLRTTGDEREAIEVDADAVIIATPPETHARLTIEALERGRHVYVEKPMATSMADARSVARLATSSGLAVQIGFAYRFHPLWQRLSALVGRGRLELPVEAEAVFDGSPGTGWSQPIIDLSCHHIDLLSNIVGLGPIEVEVHDERVLTVRWANGSSLVGTYGPGSGRDEARLRFGTTNVQLDRRRGLRLRGAGFQGSLPSPALVRARPGSTGWERSFERALAAFVATTRRGGPPRPGPADGVRALAVSLATARSMTNGGAVKVDADA